MNYKIDIKRISDGNIHIQGWVLPRVPSDAVSFKILLNGTTDIDFKLTRMLRNDVAEVYLDNYSGDKNFGFECFIIILPKMLLYIFLFMSKPE